MNGVAGVAVEMLLLFLLGGGMLLAAVVAARQIFADENFIIGYYVAIHNDLVRWIWKRLRIEKKDPG